MENKTERAVLPEKWCVHGTNIRGTLRKNDENMYNKIKVFFNIPADLGFDQVHFYRFFPIERTIRYYSSLPNECTLISIEDFMSYLDELTPQKRKEVKMTYQIY